MRIKKPGRRTIQEPKDWDFDFSIYENKEKEAEKITTLKKDNKPKVLNLKSRYSPWSSELDGLSIIKLQISKYGIRVASNTQDINDLWKMFGCLNEFWARIHDIHGQTIIDDMQQISDNCLELLNQANTETHIPYTTHQELLHYRNMIYRVCQRTNLAIEVDIGNTTIHGKAQKGIIE